MKTRKPTEKQRAARFARFREAYLALLEEVGAVATPGGPRDHRVETPLGPLDLSIHDGDLAVFGRFDDVPRAVAHLGRHDMNPYSGKWNHHYGDPWPPADAVADFASRLRRILSIKPTQEPA